MTVINIDLSAKEREQIAEILTRRANEIAVFKMEHERTGNDLASVLFAMDREIDRLRRLAGRVNPDEEEIE